MAFDAKILESLLHQSEGSALDFKSKQYSFDNIGEKAELLKDILAFANSWRLTSAYVLIGVREVKGGRSEVIGVENHLEDANIHQFVNEKTQRPVDFSYIPYRVGDLEIGIIEIPIQERPIYLTKRFGGLSQEVVFIRDGSSTRIATPDEVAKMGAERVLYGTPQLMLEWADIEKRAVLPSPHLITTTILDPSLPDDTFGQQQNSWVIVDPFINPDYSSNLIMCAFERNLFTPLGFRLRNEGGVVGKKIRFVGKLAKSDGLVLQSGLEELPSRRRDLLPSYDLDLLHRIGNDAELDLTDRNDRWEIEVEFGDVRPKDEVWTANPLFLGSGSPGPVCLTGELRGENLSEPIKCELQVRFEVHRREMTIQDVKPYM